MFTTARLALRAARALLLAGELACTAIERARVRIRRACPHVITREADCHCPALVPHSHEMCLCGAEVLAFHVGQERVRFSSANGEV